MIRRLFGSRSTLGLAWLFLLFVSAFAYAMFQGGFVSWFLFYSYVPLFLYSLAIAFYSLRDFQITRRIEKHELNAGEPLTVTIDIERRFPLPLFYLVVEDHAPENMLKRHRTLRRESTKALLALGFGRRASVAYTIDDMPRGEYRLNAVTIKTGDIFGFVQRTKTFQIEQSVLVYPKIDPMMSWLPPDHAFGGRRRSHQLLEYDLTAISSVREYIPGDRLSWLDWKATARTNQLVTKQFENPVNQDIIIVLDRTADREDESGTRFEIAVALSASLADKALRIGSAVGFLSLGRDAIWIALRHQAEARWAILHHLASCEPDGGADGFYGFDKYANQFYYQSTVIFVTTRVTERMVLIFYDLANRGLAIELVLVADVLDQSVFGRVKQLEAMGVVVHVDRGGRLETLDRAGDSLATS